MTGLATTIGRSPDAQRWTIAVIDGPNMSNIAARDGTVYGGVGSIEGLHKYVKECADSLGVDVIQMVSNHEGEILEFIHETAAKVDAFIINPAGLTFYGESTRWALVDSDRPYTEVHFRNIEQVLSRVPYGTDHRSRFSTSALGVVHGFQQHSYLAALVGLVSVLDDPRLSGDVTVGKM